MNAKEQTNKRPWWRWGRWVALALLGGLLLLKWFVIDLYTIPQEGMLPGISPGGRFWAWKRPYRDPSQVERGDVLVYARRLDDGNSYQFVWRVVGLPGDHIELEGDSVRVNGQELARDLVRSERGTMIYRETSGRASYEVAYPAPPAGGPAPPAVSLTVPPGEFFVLGDNRHHARDSRYDGTVPFATIIARKY